MSPAASPSLAVKPSVTLKRRLNAPAEKVYAAWTDPEKLIRWFGPADTRDGSVKADMDVRVGGRFKVGFNTLDGEYHQVGGEYKDVVPGRKLVFSWAWHSTPERESLVTVTMKQEEGGTTMLTLLHEKFFDEAARDGHARGWTGTLDKLEKMFA